MNRRGFTLLELLIAVTILTVIMGIVYGTLSSVVNSTQDTRDQAKWMRRQQFLARSFERNFSAAYLDRAAQDPVAQFVGTKGDGPDGPADSVTFCTTATIIGGASLPGDLKQVHYELVDSSASAMELGYQDMPDSAKRGGIIQATETPVLGANLSAQLGAGTASQPMNLDQNGSTQRLPGTPPVRRNASSQNNVSTQANAVVSPQWSLPEIRSLSITYFDGIKYVDEWDSAALGRLPWYVDIKISYWKSDAELEQEKRDGLTVKDDPDFEMIIPVAMGLGSSQAGVQLIQQQLAAEQAQGSNSAQNGAQSGTQNSGSGGTLIGGSGANLNTNRPSAAGSGR